MQIHVETLFTSDDRGRLLRVNEAEGKEAPRFFLGRTAEGNQCWFGWDVPDALVEQLQAVCLAEAENADFSVPPHGALPYETLLASAAPIEHTSAGPAYRFPESHAESSDAVLITPENATLLLPQLPEWLDDVALRQPMLASVANGQAVAVCCSVRKGTTAHEVGVETAPAFRRRGHACRVVGAWASAVRRLGRIPLYSTSWSNGGSQAVAAKLGLVRYGTVLHIR